MMRIFTIPGIKLIANVIIAIILISGIIQIAGKTYKLVMTPEEINIVKIDVPWFHNRGDVSILLDGNSLAENNELYLQIQKNVFMYHLTERIIYIPLLITILILLKRLIISINAGTFFDLKNIKIINYLALMVVIYVICKFILYQMIPYVIPQDLMVETVNLCPLSESVFTNFILAVDFKMLFVGVILYVISRSFKEGYQLKREAELTI